MTYYKYTLNWKYTANEIMGFTLIHAGELSCSVRLSSWKQTKIIDILRKIKAKDKPKLQKQNVQQKNKMCCHTCKYYEQ